MATLFSYSLMYDKESRPLRLYLSAEQAGNKEQRLDCDKLNNSSCLNYNAQTHSYKKRFKSKVSI
jgi:hypothetical protein